MNTHKSDSSSYNQQGTMQQHPVRKSPLLSQTIRLIRYKMAAPYVGRNVLDVGCGMAYLVDFMPVVDAYVGLDMDTHFLQLARHAFPHYPFYQADLDNEPLHSEITARRFDTVTLLAVLEHLAYPQRAVQQLASLLLPGGRMVITTPTPLGHRVHRLGSYLGLFNYEAVEDHKSILGQRELTGMLHAAGLHVEVYQQFELGCNQLIVGSV
jgi:2-polyprenyl-3-methyl-5-hydroxy-6-metoxy-1,4-benzoquinol methylase